MKVLVTGARGFIGRNLVSSLENLRDGYDRRAEHAPLAGVEVLTCPHDCPREELESLVAQADYVFHLAGVNRPDDVAEFETGNVTFTEAILTALEDADNTCPLMFASSVQAFDWHPKSDSPYARSKREAERLVFEHAKRAGSKVHVYRLANVFGKWCRSNYNSVVATFCDALTHGDALAVDDSAARLELLYIDDLVEELLRALMGRPSMGEDGYAVAGPTTATTVGELAESLREVDRCRHGIAVSDAMPGGFDAALEATYYSFVDPADALVMLSVHEDERGSFAEFVRGGAHSQVSILKVLPGAARGQHWHHTKRERFFAVAGHGVVRMRRHGVDENGNAYPVFEYELDASRCAALDILPGYTHNISNADPQRELVVAIWASEQFDEARPDTFFEEV